MIGSVRYILEIFSIDHDELQNNNGEDRKHIIGPYLKGNTLHYSVFSLCNAMHNS